MKSEQLGTQQTAQKNLKNFVKSAWQIRKDVLTYKSSRRTQERLQKASFPVPCKLNNVKTNYNTLDNNELFKISCKRILSQRKFLSNIC